MILTQDQQNIRDAVLKLCSRFPDEYWLERDRDGVFPHEFHQAMAADGWLGIAMPEQVGGAGLGITEAAIMMIDSVSSSARNISSMSMNSVPLTGSPPMPTAVV